MTFSTICYLHTKLDSKKIFENHTHNYDFKLVNSFIEKNKLKPVKIYNNLHLVETRKSILDETKNLSGIYLIFNNISSHYYIGSASTNRFYARFSNHLIYLKGSKILKNAVKTHKLENFTFMILELFPETVTKENNKLLLDLEDFYLKTLLPDYNILTEAGSSFGYKHTEVTRIKMINNYSLKRRITVGNINSNKRLSSETIEKMRAKSLNRKKRTFSSESLLSMKKNSKGIIVYNLNKTVYGNYFSINEAAKSLNCSHKTITRSLKTEKKLLKRKYIVNYSNN